MPKSRDSALMRPPGPEPTHQIFLLSPARCEGERAQLLLRPRAEFPLARQVRSPGGAPLGEVFSFMSGLYVRGKLAYARAFGRPPPGLPGALVISPAEGLRYPEEMVTAERIRAWAKVDIDLAEPRYLVPLTTHLTALAAATDARCRFVLLGSVAEPKYVTPMLSAFGDRLFFPSDFVGRGDMSRGALLLRAARLDHELPYAPVGASPRKGLKPVPAAELRPLPPRRTDRRS
jgi:hypothetical protein